MSLPVLRFVTGNAEKVKEVASILGGEVPLESVKLDLPELQGEPIDIAKEKAKIAFRLGRENF
jgi:inosine triphosphate pyrophosphatase